MDVCPCTAGKCVAMLVSLCQCTAGHPAGMVCMTISHGMGVAIDTIMGMGAGFRAVRHRADRMLMTVGPFASGDVTDNMGISGIRKRLCT